jgi:hypothetical protein
MKSKCDLCPVVNECVVQWTNHYTFCKWVSSGDQLKRMRVIELSIAGRGVAEKVIVDENIKPNIIKNIPISNGAGGFEKIPLQESVRINKLINECQYRHKNPPCGCGGARCSVGKGRPDPPNNSIVTFWDCAACIAPDVEMYSKHAYKK